MLTYAQEIDEKLSNCKESRNKYYQICQQLTTKYSKLKVSFVHFLTRCDLENITQIIYYIQIKIYNE